MADGLFGTTIFRPGDPGFAELAESITPLSNIRKGLSCHSTFFITADCGRQKSPTRKRSLNSKGSEDL